MIEVTGKAGIVARMICDSASEAGIRLSTFELTYPRIIHSELLTHKMLCSNSASSRAIPFAKMAEQLTGMPVRFGQANPGMQDKGCDYDAPVFVHRYMVEAFKHWLINNVPEEEHQTRWDEEAYGYFTSPQNWWKFSGWLANGCAQMFHECGYHKQVVNRRTEADQMMKTVLSGTEFDNFFWLRNHGDADPTLEELARCMAEAREKSVPQLLKAGAWHLPYVDSEFTFNDETNNSEQQFLIRQDVEGWGEAGYYISLEQAIKVSCARTAAVSFRAEDYGLEQCLRVYDRLVGEERKHASAMQHAATPMLKNHTVVNRDAWGGDYVNAPEHPNTWQEGVSHADRDGQLWSAQYRGWIMFRKTIPGENYIAQN